MLFWPPAAAAFGFEAITLAQYGTAMGLALADIPLVELCKAILRLGGGKRLKLRGRPPLARPRRIVVSYKSGRN